MEDVFTGRVCVENLRTFWNFRTFLTIFSRHCELFLLRRPMDNTVALLTSLVSENTSIS